METYSIYPIKTQFLSMKNYSYLIVDHVSKEAALVDPAWDFHKIRHQISLLNIKVSSILLTHHHIDHVNLVGPFVNEFQANVYMHAKEIECYGFKADNLIALHDAACIPLGATTIECMHTPGHTAGGSCYLLPDCIFTGDTVFIEGCGMCSSRGGSAEEMYESIQGMKRRLQPEVRVYPGHSYGKEPGVPLKYLLTQNIYFQLGRDHFVTYRTRKNQNSLFDFK